MSHDVVSFINKGETMTVDFEALDLVRGENKSRSYNKRIDELQQQCTQLRELVADAVEMIEKLEGDSNYCAYADIIKARLKKI
tara:strand:+ start:152 stop:400 length:249 start_codon:yes stop_codon:yes gene_type:complete